MNKLKSNHRAYDKLNWCREAHTVFCITVSFVHAAIANNVKTQVETLCNITCSLQKKTVSVCVLQNL